MEVAPLSGMTLFSRGRGAALKSIAERYETRVAHLCARELGTVEENEWPNGRAFAHPRALPLINRARAGRSCAQSAPLIRRGRMRFGEVGGSLFPNVSRIDEFSRAFVGCVSCSRAVLEITELRSSLRVMAESVIAD